VCVGDFTDHGAHQKSLNAKVEQEIPQPKQYFSGEVPFCFDLLQKLNFLSHKVLYYDNKGGY